MIGEMTNISNIENMGGMDRSPEEIWIEFEDLAAVRQMHAGDRRYECSPAWLQAKINIDFAGDFGEALVKAQWLASFRSIVPGWAAAVIHIHQRARINPEQPIAKAL